MLCRECIRILEYGYLYIYPMKVRVYVESDTEYRVYTVKDRYASMRNRMHFAATVV